MFKIKKNKNMNNPGLRAVIQQLKETNLKENAYLGLFYNNNQFESCYIKANKEGLELYAAKLLEASLDIDDGLIDGRKKDIFNLPSKCFSKDSDIQISFIELKEKDKAKIASIKKKHNTHWKDILIDYIVISCLIFALVLIIISALIII